ncbi:MAG: Gfo/Idh/MocA family oxidoreductase [Pseudomonadota bacterium]
MRYGVEQLQTFWQAAARPGPLLIVGGGRWGRVWASVAARARGTSDGIALLSRHHAPDVAQWSASAPGLADLVACSDMACVVQAIGQPHIAIIASRPRNHVHDADEALDAGAHVLVEKPLSDDVAAGRGLVRHAMARDLRLGIGTEFAYLPTLHHFAWTVHSASLKDGPAEIGNIQILWSDPAQEVRHGSQKRAHSEINQLEDLLPHMVSILRVLLPGAVLEIDAAHVDARSGHMTLTDGTGRRYDCICSKQADQRERRVQIDMNGTCAALDFAAALPVITWGEQVIPVPQEFLALSSTLRLELGAFHLLAETPDPTSPLTEAVGSLLDLQDQLSIRCAQAAL